MKISIVIPNWNGVNLLKKNLPTVIEAARGAEILVVDDASEDDSVSFLKRNFPAIKVIEKSKNEGFSSTVNKGVNEANGEIVILLNTDIQPDKKFLEHLLPHFSSSSVFAVGCMEKSIEKEKTVLRGRGEASWQKGMFVHRRGEINKTDTAWVSGGSGAFRKKYWTDLEGMDTLYDPFYWEDIDLSYRARKAGYQTIFEPKSVVIHKHEQGAIKTAFSNMDVKRIAYRNQFICIWKNISDLDFLIEHFFYLKLRVLQSLINGDKEFLMGYMDAIKLIFKIGKKRKSLQKTNKKSDKDLLPRYFS